MKKILIATLCCLSAQLAAPIFAQDAAAPASPAAVVAPAPASSAALVALTKADLEAWLKDVDQATVNKNVELIGSTMAEDVKIVVKNMPSESGPKTMEINKSDYMKGLKATWENVKDYTYERRDVVIEIDNEGKKAVISATIAESMLMQEQKVSTVTKEKAEIELRDGKPVVTLVESELSELNTPAKAAGEDCDKSEGCAACDGCE